MRARRSVRFLLSVLGVFPVWLLSEPAAGADCVADQACKAALDKYNKAVSDYQSQLQDTYEKAIKLEGFESQLKAVKSKIDEISGQLAQTLETFKVSKLKQFVDELADTAAKKKALDAAADELAQKTAAAGQAGPAAPLMPAGTGIKIVSADYGVLASPPQSSVTCDATGYFAKICEYATAETPYCTDAAITDLSKCPAEKRSTRLTRTTRFFCEVPISKAAKLCGDYDPAPMGERKARIVYKCGSTQQPSLLLKEGEIAYLRCG